jgi:kynurenine formamidase
MLHTGWDKYHGRTQEYLFEFPHLSKEAAKYLASKKPKAVGIDTLSVGGREGEVPAHGPTANVGADESHLPLLENNILPIEELRNLGSVLQEDEARRAMFVTSRSTTTRQAVRQRVRSHYSDPSATMIC